MITANANTATAITATARPLSPAQQQDLIRRRLNADYLQLLDKGLRIFTRQKGKRR